jgi:hypothetical protein
MIMHSDTYINGRIAALQREVTDLQRHLRAAPFVRRLPSRGRPPRNGAAEAPATPTPEAVTPGRTRRRRKRIVNRRGRVTIGPGVKLTTLPGTMYATVCKVLAARGRLAEHDVLFRAFLKAPEGATALALLQQIGVRRADLDELVRNDEEFRAHCHKRTLRYQKAAAAGNARYQELLTNSSICDAKGNWHGNLDEAIATLYGARKLTQVRHGKNLQILNKAKLMFDTFLIGDQQFCFLYRQKFYRAFRKATSLAMRTVPEETQNA